MSSTFKRVYLGIGTNLGNRRKNIDKALSYIKNNQDVRLLKVSELFRTKPEGGPKQGMFLNGVLCVETRLAPGELLDFLKSVEKHMGRKTTGLRWGPRIIDLDILIYGRLVRRSKKLTIPHKLMHERLFVLRPFASLSPFCRHPVLKKTIKKLLIEREKNNAHSLQKTAK